MEKYSIDVTWSEEDQAYLAISPEFPGLSAFGDTRTEAIDEAETALALFIEEFEEEGRELPQPKELSAFSGQVRLRMPRTIHAQLSRRADQEGTSMNQLIVTYIAWALGTNMQAKPAPTGRLKSERHPVETF